MNLESGSRFAQIDDLATCIFWPCPIDCALGVCYARKITMKDRIRYIGNFKTIGYVDFPLKRKLIISENSEESISRALSSRQMDPFGDFEMDWRGVGGDEYGPDCFEMQGWSYPCWYEDVILTRTGVVDNSFMGSAYCLKCDFTMFPYCFAYCKKLHGNHELSEEVMRRFSCFADGDSAVTGYGYFSPSYAVSLYQSLVLCGKIDEVLTSYQAFWSTIVHDEISGFVLPEQFRYYNAPSLLMAWPYDGNRGVQEDAVF